MSGQVYAVAVSLSEKMLLIGWADPRFGLNARRRGKLGMIVLHVNTALTELSPLLA
jgi:hypothetical protein